MNVKAGVSDSTNVATALTAAADAALDQSITSKITNVYLASRADKYNGSSIAQLRDKIADVYGSKSVSSLPESVLMNQTVVAQLNDGTTVEINVNLTKS